ncbi:MAG: 1-acyl-sn-glycerol-3-phosphate acyltransferase [Methylotenera sp.]|nr:1-acyl-sn-glycerol-3-phosphate acyltransferase [Methylotenera sp.]
MVQASLVTQIYRVTRVFLHTLIGLIIASVFLPFLSKNTKLALIKWWCGGLLRAFHIKVVTFGELPPASTKSVMFVANHISWSDIHALNSKIALRFIAKSEIRSWPVFGYLVEKANTLFIDRSKRQETGKIVDITAASLISGDNLCFFPEGTTTDGQQVLPFKGSVLQAAIAANSRIWPVAIRYVNIDGSINTNMAYAGETSLIDSMHLVVKQKNATVELHFLNPINSTGKDRRHLTQAAYDAIVTKLA